MKKVHKSGLLLLFILTSFQSFPQTKNFIDQPYLETKVVMDSLITPDKIYLTITLNESDNRNKISTEEMERSMKKALESLGIDTEQDLTLLQFSSEFKKLFLTGKGVFKAKMYSLLLTDAHTAGRVLVALEKEGISNVIIQKTEYSGAEQLISELKTRAIIKARQNAENLLKPLNQNVGPVIYISDLNSEMNQPQGKAPGIRIRGASSLYGSSTAKPLLIEFSKLKFSTEIIVRFKIE